MNKQDQLEELLVDWELQRRQGIELSAHELCKDSPEFVPDMSKLIRDLKATDWLEDDDDSDDDFLSLPDFTTIAKQTDETKLPACSLSLDEFAKAIVESGLMDADQIQHFNNDYAAEDAGSLARQLIDAKNLTRFQASVLLEGRDQPLVLDRYIILDEIGAGGMGAVFKALHQQMDRVVALKILPKAAVDSPDKVKRFQREVRAAAKLEHPNIVTAFDAHESKGVHFLVMSYVNGSDLSQTVRKQGPMSVGKAVKYITQAATGLAHAHEQGICHRDVKPANLLLDKRGAVKILDMGLARIEDAEPEREETLSKDLTQAGAVMGTIAYIAPEQALDTHCADARSDIYSLGCTLYYLLTAKPVYRESTMMKTIMAHQQSAIPSLGESRDDVPDELDVIYQRMVAKNPDDRFQSMADVVDALDVLDIEDEEEEVTDQIDVGSEAMHETATFVDTSRDVIATKPAPQSTKRPWLLIAAGLLGIVGLIWAAGTFIKVETPAGTIVLEIDDPNAIGAVVTVDGKTITIDQKGQMPIKVTADEKELLLKVTKGGFETFTDKFSLGAGGKKNVRVRLEKTATAMADPEKTWTDREVAEWVIGIGGSVSDGVNPGINKDQGVLPGNFKLVQLWLRENKNFRDDDFSRLAGRQHLRIVVLYQSAVTDAALFHLKDVTSIETLHLDFTNTSSWISEMKSLSSLKILSISHTHFSEADWVHVGKLTSLEHLDVGSTSLTDKGLAQLSGLKNLKSLLVGSSPISNDGLSSSFALFSTYPARVAR